MDNEIKLGPAEENQGGRHRESNLACSLEAVLGAYYLSSGGKYVEEFINKYILPYAKDIDEHFEKYNAKDVLQQYTQGVDKTLPVYKTITVSGPAHKPEFEIAVEWHGNVVATAEYCPCLDGCPSPYSAKYVYENKTLSVAKNN